MQPKAMKIASIMAIACLALALAGCAATYTGLRYNDLKVENKMSASIFLEPVAPGQRTVYVQVRNTSDKPFDVRGDIMSSVMAAGYKIVDDPNKANYMLQANILSVGLTDESALEKASLAGFGGVAMGAGAGALLGGSRAGAGAVVGGLAAGAAELVSGALVKVNTYGVITDIQLSERVHGAVSQEFKSSLKQGTARTTTTQTSASTTDWKKYQTRIVSSARQTNLTWEEAYPALRQGIGRAIGGLF